MNQLLLPRGPWCCKEGERLGVTVCPECAETSAAYQSCLGPGLRISGTDFVFFIHPDMERDIRNMIARDKWAKAYRLWRHAGKPPATCQQILAGDYTPEPFSFDEYAEFEMGAWEGIRAITAN